MWFEPSTDCYEASGSSFLASVSPCVALCAAFIGKWSKYTNKAFLAVSTFFERLVNRIL